MNFRTFACQFSLTTAACAQTTFDDSTGEVAVPGGPFPHLDISSVEVTANIATNQITFRIFVDGDPTNPNWGNYMIAVKSDAGGDTAGTGWNGRPIHFLPGMTHWIGTWNTGGQIWTYGASWTQTGSVTPVKDATLKSIALTMPFSALALSSGEIFTFDVYSSGGTGTDGAVDALSVSGTSITAWNQEFTSTEPLSFTMPSASDTDGDGLPDAWEMAHFGDLAQKPGDDPDGDLLDNAGEFARSTNPKSADTDNDGLSDKVEDNSGIYAGPASPGTSPVDSDTDNDTYPDGAEVSGAALGFESNPLRRNFAVMALPGNFNSWSETGAATPSNMMTRAGATLTTQYQYVLDYRFTTSGQAIEYKFAGGSWSDNWGGPGGVASFNGANITAAIAATGIHRFTFDQITLAYTFTRPAFADAAAFLAAYGLAEDPNGDADGDGLTNSAEFARNSDPGNGDTDGDGTGDSTDPDPLSSSTAYDLWIAGSGVPAADRGRDADPDNDGRSNLAEFLMGGNPASAADPSVTITASGPNVVIVWLGRASSSEAVYVIQTNPSLDGAWTDISDAPSVAADQSGVPAGYTRFQVITPRTPGHSYYRIKATAL